MGKLNHTIPHVVEYRNGYRYRRVVPSDVRPKIGRKNWVKTFPPSVPVATIERTAKHLAAEHDRQIAVARGQDVGAEDIATAEAQAREWLTRSKAELYETLAYLADDPTPADKAFLNAVEYNGRYVPDALTLTAAYERDKRLYGGERYERPIEYAVNSFVQLIGDKDIKAITRADASEWLAALASNGMAPPTIKRRVGSLRAIVNRAYLDFDHNARNPFEQHKIKGGQGRSDDRLPFNKSMLDQIDRYLARNRLGHETKNIIRLMKGTGAGPAEIGGLALSDVRLDGEIPFIWIRPSSIRGLKAEVRDRQIPLLGETLEAAKDAYKRAMVRTKGHRKTLDIVPLFRSFGINGRGADSISAKLNKAIRSAGVPKSPRLTAYSFRHTIKEALRSAGVVDHVQRRLLGHAGAGVADRYGSPRARLCEARDALTAALSHLGDVDESIYSTREQMRRSQ